MESFFNASWNVLLQLAPWLLLGALVAGLLHILLPKDFLKRHLSGSKGVLKAVIFGIPLPLCSCGVVPVGLSMKKGGSTDGATVAFLISTPQTGVDSIFVSASMLGGPFAIFKVVSAAITGVLGGWITNLCVEKPVKISPDNGERLSVSGEENRLQAFGAHVDELLYSIWRWLVVGILVSAAIEIYLPTGSFSGLVAYGGIVAMLVVLLISLPLYVCATASVPIAASLVASGMPTGAALVFLMAGPATNVATLGAVYRTLGRRTLAIYLVTVIVGSILGGWAFGFLVEPAGNLHLHDHAAATWWAKASAAILALILLRYAFSDMRRFLKRGLPVQNAAEQSTIQVSVEGMTCNRCVDHLEKFIANDSQVASVEVTLHPGQVVVRGEISESQVKCLIEQAGYRWPQS